MIIVGALIVIGFVFTLGVSIFGPITVYSSPPPKRRRRSNVRIRPYTPLSEEEIDEYLYSKGSLKDSDTTSLEGGLEQMEELNCNEKVEMQYTWDVVNSGVKLKNYLEKNGLTVEKSSRIETADNVIYVCNYVTFNWKKRKGQVRINCKEPEKIIIEQKTGLKAILNGKGDPTHDYSFLVDDLASLDRVIGVLKNM